MARRHPPPDPELVALARARLAHVLGDGRVGARRAARALDPPASRSIGAASGDEVDDDGSGQPGRSAVGLDDLEPPRRFTRWHLGVVVAVLLVGLVWGGWSWFRARPEAVAAPTGVQTAVGAGPGSPSVSPPSVSPPSVSPPSVPSSSVPTGSATPAPSRSSSSGSAAGGPVVHVLGAVRHPGLVHLGVGARVEDAIDAAGGLRHDADPDELNLAQRLDDGVQVFVGTRSHPAGEVRTGSTGAETGGGSTGSGSSGGSTAGAGVDLNSATLEQLDSLPGVGPVTAQKILDWREQHGRFSRAEELQEVDGIGPKTYARIAPHVRV